MRYLVIFLSFLFLGVPAHAETIPATPTAKVCPAQQSNKFVAGGRDFCSSVAICTGLYGVGVYSGTSNSVTCDTKPTRTVVPYTIANDTPGYTCPSGQGWTLSGTICMRPDCATGIERQADGSCLAPCESSQVRLAGSSACVCDPAHLAAFPSAYGGAMEGTGSSPSAACVGGCMRNTGSFCLGGGGTWWCDGGAWTSQTCSGGATDTKMPANKKPPCDPTEGVLTSSSGKVMCVPEGTPSARKPDVQKSESKATAPNGDVTQSEKTKTKDPKTGATDSTTTSTTTTAGGGSSTSTESTSSGAGGMVGGTGDNSGNEPGECAKEPDSPTCREGTVKEKGKFAEGQDATLNQEKQKLTDKINSIRGALTAAFNTSTASSGGGLPCPPPVTVLGRTINVCVNDYANQLSVIGSILVFAAGIIAILLVVTA